VTCGDATPRRTLTFDTLLESIEKARAGDKLLPSFEASVLRVFHENAGGELRYGMKPIFLLLIRGEGMFFKTLARLVSR
jgi:hypothetical protein